MDGEVCEVKIATLVGIQLRCNHYCKRANESDICLETERARVAELEEAIKKVNHDLATADDQVGKLQVELAKAKRRHTLTDLEIATIQELRKMTEDRSIRLGAKGRAVLTNAANFISSKGDI